MYLYKKRGLEKPEIEPVGLKTYLLIRIGLDVGEGQWFGKVPEPRPGREPAGKLEDKPEGTGGFAGTEKRTDGPGISVDAARTGDRHKERGIGQGRSGAKDGLETQAHRARGETWHCGPDGDRHGLWETLCRPWRVVRQKRMERKRRRGELARRLVWEQEEVRWLASRERVLCEIEAMMQRLALEVKELAGDMDSILCVYEDSIRKALTGPQCIQGRAGDRDPQDSDGPLPESGGQTGRERDTRMQEILPALWRKHFPVEEFQGYTQQFWVEQVFSQATGFPALPPRFVILGTASGLPQVLEAYVRRMRSLRWILLEAEWNEELSVFTEDFYTEYGLAIELQLVEDEAALKRLRLFSRESVSIVDFTGESYMAVSAAPEGSVWLDMRSVEEKRRRILAKGKKIKYFSMKEIWKSAQKRCNCPVLP